MLKLIKSGMIAFLLMAIMTSGVSAKDKKDKNKADKVHPTNTDDYQNLFKADL